MEATWLKSTRLNKRKAKLIQASQRKTHNGCYTWTNR